MFYSQGTYLNTSSKYNTTWRHIADTIYGLYYVLYDPSIELNVAVSLITIESTPIEYEK
jgi:hypothetical protein